MWQMQTTQCHVIWSHGRQLQDIYQHSAYQQINLNSYIRGGTVEAPKIIMWNIIIMCFKKLLCANVHII